MRVDPTHRVVLLRITRLFRPGMSEEDLYEATRGWWVMKPEAHEPDWAFAVAGGKVRAAYRIHGWELASDRRRWGFVGEPDRLMAQQYVGRDVSEHFRPGNQNPVKYVNC